MLRGESHKSYKEASIKAYLLLQGLILSLYLQIGYGMSFKSLQKDHGMPSVHGGWSSAQERDDYIQDAMLLAQPYFCHKSLGHRIKLNYSTAKYYKGYRFRINEKYEKRPFNDPVGIYQLDRVEKLAKAELGDADLMVFLGFDINDFDLSNGQFLGGTTGIASLGIACAPHPGNTKDKWSINEFSIDGAVAMAAVSNVFYQE